jgi:aerobic carbon-monoxide dehydrogenase large subunit
MTGNFNGRREDRRMLTGAGRYTADVNLEGQAYACFLRSDRAHAEIVSINVQPALAAPGVLAVLTGEDTARAGFRTPPPAAKFPGREGMMVRVPHRAVLAHGRVHHVGQEVALVVAESVLAAQDAVELVEVEYRELPAVVDAEAALAPGAPQLHENVPGNLAFDFEYGDAVKTDAAFAGAAHVTRVTVDAQRMVGNPMEPKGCVAAYDSASDVYDVYASGQGTQVIRAGLAAMTGVAPGKIRVHPLDVGGGFGIRVQAYAEYAALMLAARTVKRPVKWVGSRSETFLSDHHGRGVRLVGELALDKHGTFLGLRLAWHVNLGAYLSQAGPVINTLMASLHAINCYRIPALYGRHRLAVTNTTPTTAYRGAARPSVVYIAERLVEQAARETGIDRAELRRRNLIPKDAYPYKTPTAEYDSGDPVGCLAEAIAYAEWASFESRRKEAAARGRLRGIGCAVFVEPSGGGVVPTEEAAIRFDAAGNIVLHLLAGSTGQGHETVFPEIVAGVLGVEPENITLREGDPDGPPLVGGGTVGSRSTMMHGSASLVVAREVVRKGMELAAQALEAAVPDIEFAHGRYRVKGTDISIGLADLAAKHAGASPHPLDSLADIPALRAFPGGAHVAEVEIDPETGTIEVLRYVAVDDCGRVINHVLLEGQLHGGIMQGLGQVLGEHCMYDASSGQLVTGTFMDYTMPRADAIADVRLFDCSVPSPTNALGAKGVGEAGTTGAVPTLAHAVLDALHPLGIDKLDTPFTPDRVWHAIHAAKGGSGRPA